MATGEHVRTLENAHRIKGLSSFSHARLDFYSIVRVLGVDTGGRDY
jgi:hypothetical protein